MGTRQGRQRTEDLWIPTSELAKPAGHPFYERLNGLLEEHDFDSFVEDKCRGFYATERGRPGLVPGIYFRLLLVGYFEGIDSERGIAWRAEDSLSLRGFLAIGLNEATPDHSTISRTRRLIDLETHRQVFTWVLKVLAEAGLLKGKQIGVDATTLEANAAMRSIVRRDSGESYEEFLTGLARESGIETPTREDLARLDRKRKKKGCNRTWVNPHDRDARITKMKDGRTHLAHKAEHAVDMETGAVVAVTLQEAHLGDTTTIKETLAEAGETVAELIGHEAEVAPEEAPQVNLGGIEEVVADKGYHSGPVLEELKAVGVRTYIPEKKQNGQRHWVGKEGEQKAVYADYQAIKPEIDDAIERLRAVHGPLAFFQSGGCCDGSSPICLREGELILGGAAVRDAHASKGAGKWTRKCAVSIVRHGAEAGCAPAKFAAARASATATK